MGRAPLAWMEWWSNLQSSCLELLRESEVLMALKICSMSSDGPPRFVAGNSAISDHLTIQSAWASGDVQQFRVLVLALKNRKNGLGDFIHHFTLGSSAPRIPHLISC